MTSLLTKTGTKFMWLEKLPPNVTKVKTLRNGVVKYAIDKAAQNAEYQRTYTANMKVKGLVSCKVWIKPENVNAVREFAREL